MTKEHRIYTLISIVFGSVLAFTAYGYFDFLNGRTFDILLNKKMFISMFLVLIGIAGLAIFAATKFQRSGLLKVYLCLIVTDVPFNLINFKLRYDRIYSDKVNFLNKYFLLNGGISLLLIIAACAGLWFLNRHQKPVLKYVTIGGESFGEFAPTILWRRLVNRLVDSMVIVYTLYANIIDNFMLRQYFRGTGYGTLFLLEMCIALYYYLVLEGIFNTTIGKTITSTMVVDDTGGKPNFGTILGRTLCRHIPFDPLSFFGKVPRGWHDSISGTYVVRIARQEAEKLTIAGDEV